MEIIQKEIINILNNKFQIVDPIDVDMPLTDYGIDSIKVIQLVLYIEELYVFEFESEKLTYATLRTVRSISEYVSLMLGENSDE